ncbi:hypothetical protein IWW38_004487, partial [Coemansia aciculifera]
FRDSCGAGPSSILFRSHSTRTLSGCSVPYSLPLCSSCRTVFLTLSTSLLPTSPSPLKTARTWTA